MHHRPSPATRGSAAPWLVAFVGIACSSTPWAQVPPSAPAAPPTETLNAGSAPPEVVVTGNPLGSSLNELVAPVSTLEGAELSRRAQGSLGETLSTLPGVSSTYFGPGASRPIIRGLDGDRIRILQNSTTSLDASGLSFDHAVAIDPLAVQRIEVVRGAAALLYGGSAMGGVVNLLTNRIPEQAVEGVSGKLEGKVGGAESERGVSAVLEAGNGSLAVHADGFWRDTSDLSIPGFARSAQQRALDGPRFNQPSGTAPNTSARSNGGSLGGSYTWNQGYAGVAFTNHQSNYGSPAELGTRLDLHSNRYDAGAEIRELTGPISALKFKGSYTDYEHREISNGEVGTRFMNRGFDTRIEATQAPAGALKGVFGLQLTNSRFSALGDEAFIPFTRTSVAAPFAYEELALGKSKLTFGGRLERTRIEAVGDTSLIDASTGLPRFSAAANRGFNAVSASVGGYHPLTASIGLTANLSHSERAPTYSELFANGPHGATGSFEVGNASFNVEKSNSLDAGAKWNGGPHSASISAYVTHFQNYLTSFATGLNRGADGAYETAPGSGVTSTGGTPDFREFVYRAAPARFTGLEAESRWRLLERPATLYLELKGDLVRAVNLTTGEALPRIAPARLGAALNLAQDRWSLRLEANHALAQNRVPAGEMPTAAYTLWNLQASYRMPVGATRMMAWIEASNLTIAEARVAASILRDVLPLGGRALQAGVRFDF